MQNKNGFAAIVTVMVIALIAIGGLMYAFNKNRSSEQVSGDKAAAISGSATTTVAPSPAEVSSASGNSNIEADQESFERQPGAVVSVSGSGDNWTLGVDLLTRNQKWLPGGTEPYFLNLNPKVRSLSVTGATKAYKCSANNAFEATTPAKLISRIQARTGSLKTAYFDITGSSITAFYEQCLP